MKRSKITQLPKAVREWLDSVLAENNFAGYRQIQEELARRGHAISKSSIHRYGENLERRMGAIRASTEAAAAIAKAAPDDADLRSAAVISLIQTDVFDILVKLQEATDADPTQRAKLLSTVAKNMATLTRASHAQKRFEAEVKTKVAAAADAVAKIAKKGGLSKAGAEEIRREILGIAG